MSNEEMIKSLILAGLTPNDIFNMADSAQKGMVQTTKARKEFMNAVLNYLSIIDPELEITDEDLKSLEDSLKELELVIKNINKDPNKMTIKTNLKPEEVEKYLSKWFKALGF